LNLNVVLQLPALVEQSNPVEYGRWVRAMLRELSDEPAGGGHGDPSQPGPSTDDPSPPGPSTGDIAALTARWYAFAPHQRGRLGGIVDRLQERGYRLEPSVDRQTGEPGARSYARVLRADGANLGYLKTTSMEFVGPRDQPAVADEPTIVRANANGAPLRYPRLDITSNDAVPVLLRVANAFADDQGGAGLGAPGRRVAP